ncbi:MAG: DMT family transporter [Candidatus Binatia bacterium]
MNGAEAPPAVDVVVEGLGVDAAPVVHAAQARLGEKPGAAGWQVGRGFRYVIASAFAFSIMTSLVKVAGERLPSQEVVAARAVVSLVLSWLLVRRAGISPWGTHRRLLFFRGLLGYLALSCVFHSVAVMPLADATVIQYLYPLFTAFLATALLGETPTVRIVLAGCASLVGVALVAKPSFLFGTVASAPSLLDVGIAVSGAFFTALAYVGVKRLTELEHPLVIVFYFPLVTLPATFPALLHSAVMPQGWEWLVLLGVGVSTQAGQVWLTRGLQFESATRATALTYMQVVFATAWGAIFFAEIPDHRSVLGALLVVSGAFLLGVTRMRR